MEVPADDALLAGLAAGDRDAALAFVRRFQSRVHGVAFAVLGDGDAADEVAQQVFVRAWRSATTFDARRGTVAAWLCTIARNAAIDVQRGRRSRPTSPLDAVESMLVATGPGPAERAEEHDLSGVVVELLRRLPEPQRRAVVLAALGGRSAREVAECEAVPLGTAKTRIRDGLLRLRAALEARDPEARP